MSVRPPRLAPRRGRPRKFAAPSRALTLTLPEHVIRALEDIDPDVSRAVVRLAQPAVAKRPHAAAAELAAFGGRAVIVVRPTRTLEKRTGALLVPLSDGRALIAFDESLTPARLELKIQDGLDDHTLPAGDRRIFEGISQLLKEARRSPSVAIGQRSIMLIEQNPRKRSRT